MDGRQSGVQKDRLGNFQWSVSVVTVECVHGDCGVCP